MASLGGPVLVIDDRIDSGWTMTVAARLLREAGAPRVLPLVLAATTGSDVTPGAWLTSGPVASQH